MDLADRECLPCRGGVPPLAAPEIERLRAGLDPAWQVVRGHHLERELHFPDWKSAFALVTRVSELAESVNHHPDLELSWGRLGFKLWTHAIDGLSESDFVFAAKVDRLIAGG
jgi:4a-hydroxytetrahydrobiopterin dehydratase